MNARLSKCVRPSTGPACKHSDWLDRDCRHHTAAQEGLAHCLLHHDTVHDCCSAPPHDRRTCTDCAPLALLSQCLPASNAAHLAHEGCSLGLQAAACLGVLAQQYKQKESCHDTLLQTFKSAHFPPQSLMIKIQCCFTAMASQSDQVELLFSTAACFVVFAFDLLGTTRAEPESTEEQMVKPLGQPAGPLLCGNCQDSLWQQDPVASEAHCIAGHDACRPNGVDCCRQSQCEAVQECKKGQT